MKIIHKLEECQKIHKPCYSFEYYPPKTEEGLQAFYPRIMRMSELRPEFIDVTWGTGDPTSTKSIEVSHKIQNEANIETMMHLTCTHRSKTELEVILQSLLASDISNIMALRGNAPPNHPWESHPEGFQHANELIAWMRAKFGDHFCISAAAYPEGHREAGQKFDPSYFKTLDYANELTLLKQKVDAGVDFLVTQLCFDLERLTRFVEDCRRIGIHVPILPGILPIHNLRVFHRIAEFSASIPPKIAENCALLQSAPQSEFEDYAAELLEEQIQTLHNLGFYAIHLYTLNYERIISRVLAKNR